MMIVPIVEGKAEVQSVPELLRRIAHERGIYETLIGKAFRVHRNKIVKKGEIERAIKLIRYQRENVRAIIILIDADDDSQEELGLKLSARARKVTRLPISVILANREFEAWFLAAKESLRGFRGIKKDASAPKNPESIRGAKEELERNMERGQHYVPVIDQPAFVKKFDMQTAQERSKSFAYLIKEFEAIIAQIKGVNSQTS